MKTYSNIFEDAFTFKALMCAYKRARRGKRYKREVLAFADNVERNVLQLRDSLYNGTYRHGTYYRFIVNDAKKRHIQAAPFRDRIVHQATHAALEPIFDTGFIYDSYACRKGKGTLAAIERFERFGAHAPYVLTGDISKYFATIDHEILLRCLTKRVADKDMLAICKLIVYSSCEMPRKGIPIGNLTSQLFANIYLNELDQFVKHTLRARHYIRYMDDFVILSSDKAFLHHAREEIETFVTTRLKLAMHPKKVQIVPVHVGVDYLGYRIFPHYRKLRKSTVQRFVARVNRAHRAAGGGVRFAEKAYSHGSCMQRGRVRADCFVH